MRLRRLSRGPALTPSPRRQRGRGAVGVPGRVGALLRAVCAERARILHAGGTATGMVRIQRSGCG